MNGTCAQMNKYINKCPEGQFGRNRPADPLKKQIYGVNYWPNQHINEKKTEYQPNIDGISAK